MDVLVADDDPVLRTLLRRLVTKQGHEALIAANGEEAWAMYCARGGVNVLLTDWNMPLLDGPGLCRRIRESPAPPESCPYTYVVFLTGHTDNHHRMSAMRSGADDFLAKPISAALLQACLVAGERVTTLHAHLQEQRREAEAARDDARRTRDLLQSVIEATSDAVYAKDRDGRYFLVNTAASLFFGLPSSEILGRSDAELFPPEEAERYRRIDQQVLSRGGAGTGRGLMFEESHPAGPGGSGPPRTFLTTRDALRGSGGAIEGIVGVAHDITKRKALEAEQARAAAKDRRIAETLQANLLPPLTEGMIPGLDVHALSVPQNAEEAEVGGDFYDAFPLPHGRAALLVGDVMGKGLAAALSIAEVRFALRGFLREDQEADPAQALARLNRFLMESQRLERRPRNILVSLSLAVVDPGTGEALISCAGAEAALAVRPVSAEAWSAVPLAAGGLVLGAFPEAEYERERVLLEPGELLVFPTDGVTEARRPGGGAQFGAEGLVEAIRQDAALSTSGMRGLESLAEAVMRRVRAHVGGAPFADDLCLLLARRRPAAEAPTR
jgi:PAS domain S-box